MYNEKNPPPDNPTEAPHEPDYDESQVPVVLLDAPAESISTGTTSVAEKPALNPLMGLLSNPVLSSLIQNNPLTAFAAPANQTMSSNNASSSAASSSHHGYRDDGRRNNGGGRTGSSSKGRW
jgi:hypothetical protein